MAKFLSYLKKDPAAEMSARKTSPAQKFGE